MGRGDVRRCLWPERRSAIRGPAARGRAGPGQSRRPRRPWPGLHCRIRLFCPRRVQYWPVGSPSWRTWEWGNNPTCTFLMGGASRVSL